MAEIQRREVLDLVSGDHDAFIEQSAILPEPRLETDDSRILKQTQKLDVVDMAVGVHVRPSQRDVHTVRAQVHGAIIAAGRISSPA